MPFSGAWLQAISQRLGAWSSWRHPVWPLALLTLATVLVVVRAPPPPTPPPNIQAEPPPNPPASGPTTTLVAALLPMGPDAELLTIQGSGRNALDFHIAYYIGRLGAEFPGAAFYVVSRDTGFDPLIHHLQGQGAECRRVPSLAEIPGVPSGSR